MGTSVADIVSDGCRNQHRLLRHNADLFTQEARPDGVNPNPIEQDMARFWLVKPGDQMRDGSFTPA